MKAAVRHNGALPVWADAAYLVLMGAVAACSMLAALVADGQTPDGFRVWVLATASAYGTLYRWQRAPALRVAVREALRVTPFARRAFEYLVLLLVLLLLAAILFPVFAKARATTNRRLSPPVCLEGAFAALVRDSPDGRMPEMRTQREARERLAPHLEPYVERLNASRARRKLPPVTSDYFWEVGEGSGRRWVFNTQVSGKTWKDLTRKSAAPVLVWDEAERPAYPGYSDACRPVVRINNPHGCLDAEQWERVRPRL
jgi:hypothetical protein